MKYENRNKEYGITKYERVRTYEHELSEIRISM